MRFHIDAPKILDFDIESRPLSYLGSDFTTSEVTAIAWSLADERDVHVATLDHDPESLPRMLLAFKAAYDAADIVTGHYIRVHDLPIINGALIEGGLQQLGPKLTSDTKLDAVRMSGISKSQESLSDTLGVEADKEHMTQLDWRKANRLTPEGIARTITRVAKDVIQHKQLRAEMLRRGILRGPKLWNGTAASNTSRRVA